MLLGDWNGLDAAGADRIEADQSGWCVQEKADGVRAFLHVTEDGVRITGRTVSEVTFRLSEFAANLPHLATGFEYLVGTVLDGELVCQVEALETLIFIAECAKQTKYGQSWIEEHLKAAAMDAGTELFRIACKMATGAGKTAVIAMLIAWQTLNKRRNPRYNRYADSFLVVAPDITIKDRLRVLLPSDPGNYYRDLDLVPPELNDSFENHRKGKYPE